MGKRVSAATKTRVGKSAKSGARPVSFKFYAPQAGQVAVAGSFNEWDANRTPLRKNADGEWSAEMKLKPGRYEYRYLVDGDWQNAQDTVECVPNTFGSWNCVLEVN